MNNDDMFDNVNLSPTEFLDMGGSTGNDDIIQDYLSRLSFPPKQTNTQQQQQQQHQQQQQQQQQQQHQSPQSELNMDSQFSQSLSSNAFVHDNTGNNDRVHGVEVVIDNNDNNRNNNIFDDSINSRNRTSQPIGTNIISQSQNDNILDPFMENLNVNVNVTEQNQTGLQHLELGNINDSWNDHGNFLSPVAASNNNDDSESVYSSASSFNLAVNYGNNDLALSPAVSYLTAGEDDLDDAASLMSGNSNYLLPVNSHGYKHVTTLDELDQLLDSVLPDVHATDFDFQNVNNIDDNIRNLSADLEALNQDRSLSNTPVTTPTISVQNFDTDSSQITPSNQFVPIPTINIQVNDISSIDSTMQTNRQDRNNLETGGLLTPNTQTNDNQHEEMRQGRISRRRRSTTSRTPSRSRTRSMSPESKARSLSENRDKLLEMADMGIKIEQTENNEALQLQTPSTESKTDEITVPLPLIDGETSQNLAGSTRRKFSQKNPSIYACPVCDKKFTRPYNLKSHKRTHTNERPFSCSQCGKTFAREHDRKRHEDLHTGKKRYVCGGKLKSGESWGCGKRFARSDALGRHFKTESGRKCITPLYEEASRERGAVQDTTDLLLNGDPIM
ncbi:hypothetical protein Kpol_1003p50 [Vanderwaltozyma polyspora DSM 70294]|uniref:C2H2-type domain-containing protein n=1 Tax=Vanderwaltozyma polyspora (strain ATCC 22028 / DSM 70294 / BCRC 21397 / CBS 2163 / NBRC 10782 / NRRL Y-8283 / UCD 57-17) TaxID=436907 RepID=A7TM07_VANPO|nr:uncharacterized protein Kpol_1003p50 [Vanderwaltozyma polyspora DSM 70294]EDO16744.1 hypothetical protein Kpol_1003p50 [Vanderwaltozyma polyspora DSM 70294]